ncbi:MAG: hypothetical protein L0332_33290 [Chloroflexi bacterium]|nr:hypothetical protein [Chloroflexota bacterium]
MKTVKPAAVAVVSLLLLLPSCSWSKAQSPPAAAGRTTTPTPPATATIAATPTPTATPSPWPTATAVPSFNSTIDLTAIHLLSTTVTQLPTKTAIPLTPIPSQTPDPHLFLVATSSSEGRISNITLSTLGQLAFVGDGVLFVETAPGSGQFEEIGRYARTAAWSPAGNRLVYSLVDTPDIFNNPAGIYEQRIWSAIDENDVTLAQFFSNFPNPPYHVEQAYWSPDGTKILFQAALDERHEEAKIYLNNFILATADFSQGTFTDNKFIPSLQSPVWLTNEVYILRHHCGSPCEGYAAYDYSGQLVWSLYWDTAGIVAFAPQGNFMINAGRIDTTSWDDIPSEPYPPTVDEIDLITGEVKILWQTSQIGYENFTPFLVLPQFV